jgi:hypothetical protein
MGVGCRDVVSVGIIEYLYSGAKSRVGEQNHEVRSVKVLTILPLNETVYSFGYEKSIVMHVFLYCILIYQDVRPYPRWLHLSNL